VPGAAGSQAPLVSTDFEVLQPVSKVRVLVLLTASEVPPTAVTSGLLAGDWTVDVTFTGEGGSKFLDISKKCVAKDPVCPQGNLAIVLDGNVESAPTIQPDLVSNFDNKAQITGQFTEKEAKNLATVLRFGALPVQLTAQSTQTVSATQRTMPLR